MSILQKHSNQNNVSNNGSNKINNTNNINNVSAPLVARETFNYSAVPTDSIEKLRNNLILLSNSLKKLKLDLIKSNTAYSLPDYNSLQNQYIIIVTQLSTISSILSENSHILKKTNVYPLPISNPNKNETLFNSLLRKKPLPEVEQWLKDSESLIDNIINNTTDNSNAHMANINNINNNRDDTFILWCFNELEKNLKNYKFFEDFTQQESLSGQVDDIKETYFSEANDNLSAFAVSSGLSGPVSDSAPPPPPGSLEKTIRFIYTGEYDK